MIENLKEKLSKTRETLKGRFEEFVLSGKNREEILDKLAESMIMADVGINCTEKIIHSIKQKSKKNDSFQIIKIHQ